MSRSPYRKGKRNERETGFSAGACGLVVRQSQLQIKINVSRTPPWRRCNDRLRAVEGGSNARSGSLEHLLASIYPGSFAARTSTISMDGGAESSSDAFAINAAATLPER